MTRGRHRQSRIVQALPPVTVGAMATAGVTVALVTGSLEVLRVAVIASWVVALAIAAHSYRRSRRFKRELAIQESMRRRDESVFTDQLSTLQKSMTELAQQMQLLNSETGVLRSELVTLRAEKAEADEIVRLARAERAAAAEAQREAADQRLLTAAAFEAAAAVLESLGAARIDDVEPDWVTSWIANLGGQQELDLTMHDDTIALDVDEVREELAS